MSVPISKKYNPSIDLLRIVSIFSVVLIHTSTKILEYYNYDLVNQTFTLFLNQAFRFAVPLFFFISAFVLELNYPQDFNYFSYLKKRFSRLFLPYLFWSLIYYYFVYTINTKSFFTAFLLGDASYQLYFVPSLFIFYLVFPFLHRHIKFFARKFILIFLLIVQLSLLSLDYYFQPLPFPHPVSVFLLNFNIFVLGILASHHQVKILDFVKKYQISFISAFLILAVYITLEGRNLYLQNQNYLSFYSNWRPVNFIYTLVFSALFFYIFSRFKHKTVFINKIASYSFFVYLVHVIIIEITWILIPHPFLSHPFFFLLATLIPSYLLAFLVSKIPHLSKITG